MTSVARLLLGFSSSSNVGMNPSAPDESSTKKTARHSMEPAKIDQNQMRYFVFSVFLNIILLAINWRLKTAVNVTLNLHYSRPSPADDDPLRRQMRQPPTPWSQLPLTECSGEHGNYLRIFSVSTLPSDSRRRTMPMPAGGSMRMLPSAGSISKPLSVNSLIRIWPL